MKKVYLIALIVALIAGGATWIFAQALIERSSIKDAKTKEVIVAQSDVPEGTAITADNVNTLFAKKVILEADVTEGTVTNVEDIVGLITTQKVFKEEYVNKNRFMTEDSDEAGLSFKLLDNEVAYSIRINNDDEGVSGFIIPGDTVDIVSYSKGKVTVEFTDLLVLKVATKQANTEATAEGTGEVSSYTTLTIKTTDSEAEQIYDMECNSESFKFILNSRVAASK